MRNRIKTIVLTGFLGAGKTTLLNQLLGFYKGQTNYVIENEFGNTSVDSALVAKNYNQLFELNNGCICCSLDNELIEVLTQLIQMEKQPDHLFIEASGVADAGMIASIFQRDDVRKFFELAHVICLVDAENFEDRINEVPELSRQVVAANQIIINKTDLVQSSYVNHIKALVSKINPLANTITKDEFSHEILAKNTFAEFDPSKLNITEGEPGKHKVKSIAISTAEIYDRQKLYAALSMTLYLSYHQIYRVKGFVKIEGENAPVLIQSTGNTLSFTKHENTQNQKEVIIFIGVGIEREGLTRILNRAVATPISEKL